MTAELLKLKPNVEINVTKPPPQTESHDVTVPIQMSMQTRLRLDGRGRIDICTSAGQRISLHLHDILEMAAALKHIMKSWAGQTRLISRRRGIHDRLLKITPPFEDHAQGGAQLMPPRTTQSQSPLRRIILGHTRDTRRARQAREAPERSPLWRWMGGAVAALVTANCVGLIPGPLHMDAAWRGMPWRVANGHISTYKRLVDDGQTDAVLAGDPWGNQAGSEERWTFRQAACEPLLRVGQDDRDDAFESRLYAPLKQRAGHAQKPSVGFAPNMRDQAVQ